MILIYSSLPFDKMQYNNQRNLIKDRLSSFFIEDNDFIYSTESNVDLIKKLILNHKIFLFYTESINNMRFSQTKIIDLITYLLKNKCCFRSENDNLTFGNNDIDKVDSSISEILNHPFIPS